MLLVTEAPCHRLTSTTTTTKTTSTFISLEVPVVTVTAEEEGEDPVEFVPSTSPEKLNYFVSEEPVSFQDFLLDNNDLTTSMIPLPPPMDESMDTEVLLTDHHTECSNTDDPKKAMNLKCCRRPYNGHTFSVSPNQVVNITSIVDYSKFSVRHLVNEFELHSKGSGGSSGESTNALEILSHKTVRSPHRTKVRAKLLDNCDTDYTSSEDNQESDSVPILPQFPDSHAVHTGTMSLRDFQTNKSSKKVEKLGCLPFFRKYSSSMSKSSQNKNAVGPGGSHTKNSSGSKSRKGKLMEKLSSESGDCISPLEQLPAKYQSTGVVKQRLEAFEAKASPHSKHQLFFRSHNRSHSATGSSGSLQFESLGHLSQRKSSMPQLGSRSSEFDSPTFQRLPIIQSSSDRKASLDSNGLFKSFPCPMVRGFQNSGSKSFFSTSPNSSSRVQHGSTHPLNLLPRTPTLT